MLFFTHFKLKIVVVEFATIFLASENSTIHSSKIYHILFSLLSFAQELRAVDLQKLLSPFIFRGNVSLLLKMGRNWKYPFHSMYVMARANLNKSKFFSTSTTTASKYGFWKFYEVRCERGDFNWCRFLAS